VKKRKNPFGLIALGIIALFFLKDRILGFIVVLIGVIWYFTLKSKDISSVRINSNSGEVDALVSKDAGYIQAIVSALNEAIAHRE